MKNYKLGIALGIISIISTFLFVGIPVGMKALVIVKLAFFIAGALLIGYFGIVKKYGKTTLLISILYVLLTLILVGLVETKYKDISKIAIGFIPGLVISLSGLSLTMSNRKKYKIKGSIVLNILALVLSIASGVLGLIVK